MLTCAASVVVLGGAADFIRCMMHSGEWVFDVQMPTGGVIRNSVCFRFVLVCCVTFNAVLLALVCVQTHCVIAGNCGFRECWVSLSSMRF